MIVVLKKVYVIHGYTIYPAFRERLGLPTSLTKGYCSNFRLGMKFQIRERLQKFECGNELRKYRSEAADKHVEACFGMGEHKFIGRGSVFGGCIVIQSG